MNNMHDCNRRHWNKAAEWWERLRDKDELWQRCPNEPELGFAGGALRLIREIAGNISGKDVCVVGSGDNYAAFALAGMGANVTSIDISEQQLEVASKRADQLELPITFVQADAAHLEPVGNAAFDLVCSSNGFFFGLQTCTRSSMRSIVSCVQGDITSSMIFIRSSGLGKIRPDRLRLRSPIGKLAPLRMNSMAPLSSTRLLRTFSTPWRPRDSSCSAFWRVLPRTQDSGKTIPTCRGLTKVCWTGMRTPGPRYQFGSQPLCRDHGKTSRIAPHNTTVRGSSLPDFDPTGCADSQKSENGKYDFI